MFWISGQPVQRDGSVVVPSAMVKDSSRRDRRSSYGVSYPTLAHYSGACQNLAVPLMYRVFGHCWRSEFTDQKIRFPVEFA
jgi:hypothetical protein